MAHSLHSLVLDVCCENSQFYSSKEEALKVLYASVFIITTIQCRYFYFVTLHQYYPISPRKKMT